MSHRRRPRFRPHRRARFILIQTPALWLCLMLICLACSGLTQGEVVVLRAMEHLGKPYVLGAAGPDQFDCSGLVMYCLEPEGFEFAIHSAELIGTDERYPLIADPRELLVGDVVCFDTVADRDPSDHMGFYIGGNRFIHASSTGEVRINALEDFYLERFTGARRYAQAYAYLPTGKQLQAWLDGTGLPERLAPAREWIESLRIPERLAPVRRWIDSLDIPGRLSPVRRWVESLRISERLRELREGIVGLWNRIFPKS